MRQTHVLQAPVAAPAHSIGAILKGLMWNQITCEDEMTLWDMHCDDITLLVDAFKDFFYFLKKIFIYPLIWIPGPLGLSTIFQIKLATF